MRTVLRVMLSLALFLSCLHAPAQETATPARDLGSVDTDVTIVGRDDTAIPLPSPPPPPDLALPDLDLTPLPFMALPAIAPPGGQLEQGLLDDPLAILRIEGLQ